MLITFLLICAVIRADCEGSLTTAGCATCAGSGSGQTCLTCNPSSNKVRPDQKGCIASCPADVSTESNGVCQCKSGYEPSSTGETCVPKTSCKTENCKVCENRGTDSEVCTECNESKYLTPTNQCTTSCAALSGYYGDAASKTCKPCSPECASCSTAGANKCLSCPAGKVLKYTDDTKVDQGGSCVDECKTGAGGCADCGAVIGGSRYCSRCSTSSEYPVNGVCKASTARANECTTPDNKGGCTTCASGYFLLDNGCYKTDRQPGSQVCTTESGGKCTQCANGMTVNSQTGVCPSCDPSCKTCGAAAASECASCFSGYYLDSTAKACKKCSENSADNKITGVKDCVSCAPPSSNPGTVTCYVETSGGGGSSTDGGPNLSSGAIAGISVAVIVVVGGLVGFLCWWFVCRGKA